ncbi:MAG: triple tyrosine motif-containing protein, partial [Bacteroidota bacterium]
IQYDPTNNTHQVFDYNLFGTVPPQFFYLAQTGNGDFWIGTTLGLIRGTSQGKGYDFALVPGTENEVCASLLVDQNKRDVLWIGTKGSGLGRLDTRTMEVRLLNTSHGLPNNVIYGVLNDEVGNLWMSSNQGIIAYTPETGKIRNFTSADGMQSNEFNTYAFGKGPRGTLFFGGINGLNEFNPEDLVENPFLPAVRITGLTVNNEEVGIGDSTQLLDQAIDYTEEITVDYISNNVELTFSALEYTTPSKNTFRYYLAGAEPAWAHTSTSNKAAYLNLDPGTYTFRVKAANGDLIWGEEVTSLDITVLPPWYRTNVAYLFYALLFGLAFWLYNRSQKNRLQLRYRLQAEQQEAERLKELEGFRSRL